MIVELKKKNLTAIEYVRRHTRLVVEVEDAVVRLQQVGV